MPSVGVILTVWFPVFEWIALACLVIAAIFARERPKREKRTAGMSTGKSSDVDETFAREEDASGDTDEYYDCRSSPASFKKLIDAYDGLVEELSEDVASLRTQLTELEFRLEARKEAHIALLKDHTQMNVDLFEAKRELRHISWWAEEAECTPVPSFEDMVKFYHDLSDEC